MKNPNRPDPSVLAAKTPDKLVVVEIPSRAFEEGKKNGWYWAIKNDPSIFRVKTCERMLLVTSKEHWEECADHEKLGPLTQRSYDMQAAKEAAESGGENVYASGRYFKKTHGYDAYNYLLKAACGLQSNDPGEEFIGQQIAGDFNQYIERINSTTWLKKIMQSIEHDQKQIRTHIIGGYRPVSEQRCGIDMMNLPRESLVLVVGDDGESVRKFVAELTNRGRKKANPAKVIDVAILGDKCSPADLDGFKARIKADNGMQQEPFSVVTMKDIFALPDCVEAYDGIIYLASLDKHRDQARKLMDIRKSFPADKMPKLLVYNSDDQTQHIEEKARNLDMQSGGNVTVMIGEKDAVTPEEIRKEYVEQMAQQELMIEQGNKACDVVTGLREKNFNLHPYLQQVAEDIKQADAAQDIMGIVDQIVKARSPRSLGR